jgi:soluble lytic murein transglycosylase-like protein
VRLVVTAFLGLSLLASTLFNPNYKELDSTSIPREFEQMSVVLDGLISIEKIYFEEVYPIEQIIKTKNPADSKRIAWAVVKHARKNKIPPDMAVAILLVENPTFSTRSKSSAGAIGLTQVMPFHAGKWACGKNLYDVETNICTGFKIFAHNLYETDGNLTKALLRYNGCVRGTRTPNCSHYPKWISAKRKFARQQMDYHAQSIN